MPMVEDYGDDMIRVVGPKLDVSSIIKEITSNGQDDCFYVCNINEIIRKHEEWKAAMPRVKPYYAIKCNATKSALETLAALGASFDCASKGEIRNILSLGIQPSRIIFANPTKKISHLEYAAANGVDKMTFDNEYELHKIKKIYPNAKLLIRIKFDDSSAMSSMGEKYGCDHSTEASNLLRIAFDLGLNVTGICFHIGSSSKDWSTYEKAIAASRHVFDLAATVGFNIEMIDIGGGFPGDRKRSINEIGCVVNSALQKFFPDTSIKIIAEPGRYYVSTAFTLASSIHSIKIVDQLDPVTKEINKIRMYYADVSIYGGFMDLVLFQEHYSMKPLDYVDSKAKPSVPSILWGPTLNLCDRISKGVVMFPRMDVGEWVIIEDVGAYNMVIACKFNGFPIPGVCSVVDEDGWLLLTKIAPYPLPQDRFFKRNT